MTYAELSEAQARRSMQFAEAQTDVMSVYCDAERDLKELQAENAKLRELVRIAGTYCVNGLCGKDDGCPLYLGKPYCALPDRMRDLGIELNDYE